MAALRADGFEAKKAFLRDVAEKENQPPRKANKRTASIAGLFEQGKRTRQKHNDHSSDEVKSRAGGAKISSDSLFASFAKPKKATRTNPLYQGFKGSAVLILMIFFSQADLFR